MTESDGCLVSLQGISKRFIKKSTWFGGPQRRVPRVLKAVDRASFDIRRGHLVGLVGESGSGKSSLARCVMRLYPIDEGRIIYDSADLSALSPQEMLPYRRKMQMVFQDPYSSLDPRMTIGSAVKEPLKVHGMVPREELADRTLAILRQVGLSEELASRRPIELSGGQRQRVGIARALALEPEFIIADEPVSALDVSIQAQIINLLHDLQDELRLTMLFISHDLRVVRHISDEVEVMYLGAIVEEGPTEEVFANPLHPYSRALLAAAPRIHAGGRRSRGAALFGETPSPYSVPRGCRFHTRCPEAMAVCGEVEPQMKERGEGRRVACHLY
jgi:oligopeptide/dipeptide ABC transporter ATP-binding protein